MESNQLTVLTVQEAAAILHRSPATLKDWRYKQIGPRYVRLGYKAIGYRPEDIEAFIEAAAITPGRNVAPR
ncbi:helix-turn-helix transcriptional regulator [Arthrobacter sp. MDT3-44]